MAYTPRAPVTGGAGGRSDLSLDLVTLYQGTISSCQLPAAQMAQHTGEKLAHLVAQLCLCRTHFKRAGYSCTHVRWGLRLRLGRGG